MTNAKPSAGSVPFGRKTLTVKTVLNDATLLPPVAFALSPSLSSWVQSRNAVE
uniref:Uncharacterized protein n=1 Tax=Arundo donax TaxID=35708 RepID=A0A0A9FFS6_ARUDO